MLSSSRPVLHHSISETRTRNLRQIRTFTADKYSDLNIATTTLKRQKSSLPVASTLSASDNLQELHHFTQLKVLILISQVFILLSR